MALSESGGVYPGVISYGGKGKRKPVRPKKAAPASARPGKGKTKSFYVRPRSGRR